jgi:hypothetical protein
VESDSLKGAESVSPWKEGRMGHAHRFALLLACSVFGACGAPEPQCQTQQVQARLSDIVREQFLWSVLGDSLIPVEIDRRKQFIGAVSISVAETKLVEKSIDSGKLRCSARIEFEAPRLDGGLNKKAEGVLEFGVIRGENGSFLVEVGYEDVTELSKKIGKQFSPTIS